MCVFVWKKKSMGQQCYHGYIFHLILTKSAFSKFLEQWSSNVSLPYVESAFSRIGQMVDKILLELWQKIFSNFNFSILQLYSARKRAINITHEPRQEIITVPLIASHTFKSETAPVGVIYHILSSTCPPLNEILTWSRELYMKAAPETFQKIANNLQHLISRKRYRKVPVGYVILIWASNCRYPDNNIWLFLSLETRIKDTIVSETTVCTTKRHP